MPDAAAACWSRFHARELDYSQRFVRKIGEKEKDLTLFFSLAGSKKIGLPVALFIISSIY